MDTQTSTVTGPLTGRKLEVKGGKVVAEKKAAPAINKNPPKAPAKTEPVKQAAKPAAPPKEEAKAAPAKGSKKVVKILAKENPHRKTSKDFDKFKKLKSGMSVKEAQEAGVDRGYLNYAAKREIVTIG